MERSEGSHPHHRMLMLTHTHTHSVVFEASSHHLHQGPDSGVTLAGTRTGSPARSQPAGNHQLALMGFDASHLLRC